MHIMNNTPITRRGLLRGLGAGLGLAPFVPLLMPEVEAAQGQTPTRLLVFFHSTGTIFDAWRPTGGVDDFQLGGILGPLAPFRDKLLVLEGLDQTVVTQGWLSGHDPSMASLLTGVEIMQDDVFQHGSVSYGWGGGISIDQHIAAHCGKDTTFDSITAGVRADQAQPNFRMSYRGPAQPVAPQNDPVALYQTLFGDLGLGDVELAQLRARRRSSIDFVLDDLGALASTVGAADRAKMEAHLDALRELETRLDDLGSCEPPLVPGGFDPLAEANFPEVGRAQMDLLVEALACDLTRVASLQWHNEGSTQRFTWLGHTEHHHALSHAGQQQPLIDIYTWYAEQLAYLLGRLDSIPEGDGTLLDHTVVAWVTPMGRGDTHSSANIPVVLAGSANGYLRSGRFLDLAGRSHNDLLVSLANAMGLEIETFGDPAHCAGPLLELL